VHEERKNHGLKVKKCHPQLLSLLSFDHSLHDVEKITLLNSDWPLHSENPDFLRSQNLIYERAENSVLQLESAAHLLLLQEVQSILKRVRFKAPQIGLIKLVIIFILHFTIFSVLVS